MGKIRQKGLLYQSTST